MNLPVWLFSAYRHIIIWHDGYISWLHREKTVETFPFGTALGPDLCTPSSDWLWFVFFCYNKMIKGKVTVLVGPRCLTLCGPTDCGPAGFCVRGILQVRTLEWAIPFSRGSSQPRDWTWVSCITGRLFTIWAIIISIFLF